MKQTVIINEIGPRDGFQNVKRFIDTKTKLRIIDGIVKAGVKRIQITSFVSPKAVPQLRDSREIARTCLNKYPEINCYALIPNAKGAEIASELGMKEVSYVISVSESHNRDNVRKSISESMQDLSLLRRSLPHLKVILDVATAFGCPIEGVTSYEKLYSCVTRAQAVGIDTFTICDSNGSANPLQVKTYMTRLQNCFPEATFRIHIHDTRNMGMINTLTAVECGVKNVETSIGGLGGCPFLRGASGNTSTEDFVYMLSQMGFETGIDFSVLLETAKFAKSNIAGSFSGHHINIADGLSNDCLP